MKHFLTLSRPYFFSRLSGLPSFLLVLVCLLASNAQALVNITPASGGTLLCTNLAVGGSAPGYTSISPILITETNPADFSGGVGTSVITDVVAITLPAGWRFNTGVTPTLSFNPGGNIQYIGISSFTATTINIGIGVNQQGLMDAITISGLQVQATSTSSADGNMYCSSMVGVAGLVTGTSGTNFGNLSTSPAAITGPTSVCFGRTITLSDTRTGGTWSSSAPSIASVAATGIVSGLALGTAMITYSLAGCTTTSYIVVNPQPAVIVGPTDLCQHMTISLSDSTAGGSWSSSVPSVATIDASGTVSGLGTSGVTAILYMLPTGCYATQFVTVHTPPAPITGASQVCIGTISTLSDIVGGGSWSSSTTAIGTVSSFGQVYGVSAGWVDISYTIPGCPSAVHTMSVNPAPAPISGITSLCPGLTTMVTDATTGGTWRSSDTTVARISSSGVITCRSTTIGATTTITYTIGGCSSTLTLTVRATPSMITGPDTVCQGASTTVANATSGGIWSSNNMSIAAVAATTGIVDGVTNGTVTLSYTLTSGCYDTMVFRVKPLVAGSAAITATPGDTVCEGTSVLYHVTSTNTGSPTYNWSVFTTVHPADTTSSFIYTPVMGDEIIVKLACHGVCALNDTVSDSLIETVFPRVSPTIHISTTDSNYITYPGQLVTFNSTVTYPGPSPSYQWFVNRVPIWGATNTSFTLSVSTNDTVWCVFTGHPRCDTLPGPITTNKIIIYGDYLSVNSVANNSNPLQLYPNPNDGSFTLSASGINNEAEIEVTDMLGRIVYANKVASTNGYLNIPISLDKSLPYGNYTLKLHSEMGVQVVKLVVDKK